MDPPNEQLLVHIRFTDAQDLSLYVFPLYDTPSSVKAMIQNEFPSTRSKNIRLIFNGQVLTSNTTILWDYGIRSSNLYMHCAISDFVKHDTTKPMRSKVTCVARGFDRLVATGFNQEEIRSIRSQFHQLQGRPFSEDQDPSDQLLQYEEQWMNQTGESVPEGTIQGAYKEMMWGLMLGLFLGVLCLFWVRESVFTRRHQLGIIVGMFLNLSFGYLRVYQH